MGGLQGFGTAVVLPCWSPCADYIAEAVYIKFLLKEGTIAEIVRCAKKYKMMEVINGQGKNRILQKKTQ
jgi:hypothetical protein